MVTVKAPLLRLFLRRARLEVPVAPREENSGRGLIFGCPEIWVAPNWIPAFGDGETGPQDSWLTRQKWRARDREVIQTKPGGSASDLPGTNPDQLALRGDKTVNRA